MKTKEPNNKDWSRFVNEGLTNWTEENQSNVKYDFSKMSKIFGLSYIYWLELQFFSYVNGGGFTADELCKWNGNFSVKFLDKFAP